MGLVYEIFMNCQLITVFIWSGFVLVIQGRDLLQLKIVKQQYRGSVKRANELKMKVELYRVSSEHVLTLNEQLTENVKSTRVGSPIKILIPYL